MGFVNTSQANEMCPFKRLVGKIVAGAERQGRALSREVEVREQWEETMSDKTMATATAAATKTTTTTCAKEDFKLSGKPAVLAEGIERQAMTDRLVLLLMQ